MATECDFELPPEFLASASPQSSGPPRPASPGDRGQDLAPATGPSDASEAEREFFEAIREYKRSSGRMFPTWSEILEIARGLGYRKSDEPSPGR